LVTGVFDKLFATCNCTLGATTFVAISKPATTLFPVLETTILFALSIMAPRKVSTRTSAGFFSTIFFVTNSETSFIKEGLSSFVSAVGLTEGFAFCVAAFVPVEDVFARAEALALVEGVFVCAGALALAEGAFVCAGALALAEGVFVCPEALVLVEGVFVCPEALVLVEGFFAACAVFVFFTFYVKSLLSS
jgi:hypothetical protein